MMSLKRLGGQIDPSPVVFRRVYLLERGLSRVFFDFQYHHETHLS